jgi:hypothetical protein
MMKAILFAIAAAIGCVLSILLFSVIDFPFHLPFAVDESGFRTAYGPLMLGGVGTIGGVLIG